MKRTWVMLSKTFKKSERLSKKKEIQELFEKGSSFYLYPFKIFYQVASGTNRHQVLISVPKKIFKKAVDRNKIKRRIREAFRLNKYAHETPDMLKIAYIYTSKEVLSFQEIQKKLILAGERLNKNLTFKKDENEKNTEG